MCNLVMPNLGCINNAEQFTIDRIFIYCVIVGSGEDRCLHEVRQIHEDPRQQQDGQMGKPERVTDKKIPPKLLEPCSQVQLNN